jgi:hypothetical protein
MPQQFDKYGYKTAPQEQGLSPLSLLPGKPGTYYSAADALSGAFSNHPIDTACDFGMSFAPPQYSIPYTLAKQAKFPSVKSNYDSYYNKNVFPSLGKAHSIHAPGMGPTYYPPNPSLLLEKQSQFPPGGMPFKNGSALDGSPGYLQTYPKNNSYQYKPYKNTATGY